MLVTHPTTAQLEAGLEEIRRSPKDAGEVTLIARRPRAGSREVLDEARLDPVEGLVGDTWRFRPSSRMPGRTSPHPGMQITIMNARVIALVAQDPARWALAGDQFYVDLDLSAANLPPGTRLAIGSAILEVTPEPHTGCGKFVERFGRDAMTFVNSPIGRQLSLRGINARVVQGGMVRRGDVASKI